MGHDSGRPRTPGERRHHERIKSCQSKKRYTDLNVATRDALFMLRREEAMQAAGVYECDHCPHYHVTSKPNPDRYEVVILLEREDSTES